MHALLPHRAGIRRRHLLAVVGAEMNQQTTTSRCSRYDCQSGEADVVGEVAARSSAPTITDDYWRFFFLSSFHSFHSMTSKAHELLKPDAQQGLQQALRTALMRFRPRPCPGAVRRAFAAAADEQRASAQGDDGPHPLDRIGSPATSRCCTSASLTPLRRLWIAIRTNLTEHADCRRQPRAAPPRQLAIIGGWARLAAAGRYGRSRLVGDALRSRARDRAERALASSVTAPSTTRDQHVDQRLPTALGLLQNSASTSGEAFERRRWRWSIGRPRPASAGRLGMTSRAAC